MLTQVGLLNVPKGIARIALQDGAGVHILAWCIERPKPSGFGPRPPHSVAFELPLNRLVRGGSDCHRNAANSSSNQTQVAMSTSLSLSESCDFGLPNKAQAISVSNVSPEGSASASTNGSNTRPDQCTEWRVIRPERGRTLPRSRHGSPTSTDRRVGRYDRKACRTT